MEMPEDRVKPGRPKKLRRVDHDEVIPRGGTKMRRRYVATACNQHIVKVEETMMKDLHYHLSQHNQHPVNQVK
jgi:hypothetical protein